MIWRGGNGMWKWLVAGPLALMLVACSSGKESLPLQSPVFFDETNPQTLREWGMVQASDGRLVISKGVVVYDLNTPLFTDYAQKLRTIWMPSGAAAKYKADGAIDFPVGAVISKTFFYQLSGDGRQKVRQNADLRQSYTAEGDLDLKQIRLIETRLLIRRKAGWSALTYLWDDDQKEATLKRSGAAVPLELVRTSGTVEPFNYVVPNATQCASCHVTDMATKAIQPVGPTIRNLNRDYPHGGEGGPDQIDRLIAAGFLTGAPPAAERPRLARWDDARAPIEARARAYLEVNCSHCHSTDGPADTSGLYLDHNQPMGLNFGLCKLPVAAGSGTGNRRFDIVPGKPDESIITYRMASTNPAERMPEIGRSTAHDEAVALMRKWIERTSGSCQ